MRGSTIKLSNRFICEVEIFLEVDSLSSVTFGQEITKGQNKGMVEAR